MDSGLPHAQSRVPRLPSNALPVPIVRQATDYSCGAAAMLGVLQYWGLFQKNESALYPLLQTTEKDGTRPEDLLRGGLALGLTGTLREKTTLDELRAGLRRGDTILLDLQAWSGKKEENWEEVWEEGHYVVLVAMDRTFAYFMDPVVGTGYVSLPLAELVSRWHDYENLNGVAVRNYQLALFFRGTTPLRQFPGPLRAME
jgi:uncharacterized protein